MSGEQEFDRQLNRLIDLGYAALAGLNEKAFRAGVEPLRSKAPSEGDIPFLIVLPASSVDPEQAGALIERRSKGVASMFEPGELAGYAPVDFVDVPAGDAYLATEIKSVGDTVGLTPEEATKRIREAGRSPLTLEEGIALATHFPEAIAKNACFQMPGSRDGSKRIASIWLSKGAPKLGWCWAGNPHTWLGSASCGSRLTSKVD